MIVSKRSDGCDYCGDADDECAVCHDFYEHLPANCPHGEDHATWYYRDANHDAGTLTVSYSCGLCGGSAVARVEPLSISERLWNNLCQAARDCSIDITSRAATEWLCRTVECARELGLLVNADELFDHEYQRLSVLGKCDGPGGHEYQQVRDEWHAAGRPTPIAPFIVEAANAPRRFDAFLAPRGEAN